VILPRQSARKPRCAAALNFAEEFGISTSFEPFTLIERRGG